MEQIVLQRIAELWKWRAWYRQHNAMTLSWPVRWSNAAELRALVKLAREARKAERPDFVDHPADETWNSRAIRRGRCWAGAGR